MKIVHDPDLPHGVVRIGTETSEYLRFCPDGRFYIFRVRFEYGVAVLLLACMLAGYAGSHDVPWFLRINWNR